jgi:hypothetical protein
MRGLVAAALPSRQIGQHPNALAARIGPAWAGLRGRGEDPARLFEVIAGVKKIGDVQAVLGPFFDLVQIAIVREVWILCFLVGPTIAGTRATLSMPKPHQTATPRRIKWQQ